jgi:hypothetical protein
VSVLVIQKDGYGLPSDDVTPDYVEENNSQEPPRRFESAKVLG